MANTLTATLQVTGQGLLEKDTDMSAPADPFSIGSNGFDEIKTELTDGTGSGQANSMWLDERTINASSNDDLDLAGGLTNVYGETITFTAIKVLLIAIDSPDGTKSVRLGPANVSNGWQGPWGGTGATVYETIHDWSVKSNKYGGWSVTAGTGDILRITNPSGSASVTYRILLIGTV